MVNISDVITWCKS